MGISDFAPDPWQSSPSLRNAVILPAAPRAISVVDQFLRFFAEVSLAL
jgi:hypothetical protein